MRTDARKKALAAGEKRYFSGTPCKNGNVAERITSCGRCVCEVCKAEHAKKVVRAYRERTGCTPKGQTPRALAKLAGEKRYKDGKTCKFGNVSYKLTSNGVCLCTECERERRERDPELRARVMRNWREANPATCREHGAKRRAALRVPPWANREAIEAVYRKARELQERDGIKRHVDHEIPLCGRFVSGLHVENNLQILTARQNLSKRNKFEVA